MRCCHSFNAIASKLALTDENAGLGKRPPSELKAYSKVFDVPKLIPGARAGPPLSKR